MRLSGWFNSHKSTEPNVILAGLTKIITEIHEKEKQEINKNINFPTKNDYLKKYGAEILKLHKQGYGVRKIAKHLKIYHNIKIGATTIYNFIKAQNG
jgi:IS30 family transposase